MAQQLTLLKGSAGLRFAAYACSCISFGSGPANSCQRGRMFAAVFMRLQGSGGGQVHEARANERMHVHLAPPSSPSSLLSAVANAQAVATLRLLPLPPPHLISSSTTSCSQPLGGMG